MLDLKGGKGGRGIRALIQRRPLSATALRPASANHTLLARLSQECTSAAPPKKEAPATLSKAGRRSLFEGRDL